MKKATVKNVDFNTTTREITITVSAKDSMYVNEPKPDQCGFPSMVNSGPLVEGVNLILAGGHLSVAALKDNFQHDNAGEIVARVKQFLSALDYEKLNDFQAKCALLLERAISEK